MQLPRLARAGLDRLLDGVFLSEVLGAEKPDRAFFDAVCALPVKYRSPVILHYYQGLSAGEIAGILRLPGATVRTRLARARALLRNELEGWYFDEE